MMVLKYIKVLFIIFLSCKNYVRTDNKFYDKSIENINVIDTFYYDSLTIPHFFTNLINNHLKDFYNSDSADFIQFCKDNNILKFDSMNITTFFKIKIMHLLFTSKNASNGSVGEILKIPYLWHWIQPNPRHEIIFLSTRKYLKETKPPLEFSKYSSYADIDRTPYLFLRDLVEDKVKFFSNQINDSFSTFGWCSEREMAFVSLMSLMNFKGKVVAEGNHSWSEFIVTMKNSYGENKNFKVKVDNTFDILNWEFINENKILSWEKYVGNTNLSNWYNNKAKSQLEQKRIKNQIVSKQASLRIEYNVINYLKLNF